jgi:hypothetical protein
MPGLSQSLEHNSLLDELTFWMVQYEFPQKIVTLLLSLLPDDNYKVSQSDIYTIVDLFCENGFLRAIMHRRPGLKCEME